METNQRRITGFFKVPYFAVSVLKKPNDQMPLPCPLCTLPHLGMWESCGLDFERTQLGRYNVLSTSAWKAPCKEKHSKRNFCVSSRNLTSGKGGWLGEGQPAVCFSVRAPQPGAWKTRLGKKASPKGCIAHLMYTQHNPEQGCASL